MSEECQKGKLNGRCCCSCSWHIADFHHCTTAPEGLREMSDNRLTNAEHQEQAYIQGSRMAWLSMFRICLKELGIDNPDAEQGKWILEREMTVQKLREVCRVHGDNDWTAELHLADVIDKHLLRHLKNQ
jgi:hypothetical protein